MSSNTEAEGARIATVGNVAFFAVLIIILLVADMLFVFGPTYTAIKRIEANQQSCQGK